ncbi:MAG: polysaccharide biosynthesis protein [Clostridia bacterium]|nr:polysaccharide biosynthesis protein [Clostridia bacterium]
MSSIAHALSSKRLRFSLIVLYDAICLTLALFLASVLHYPNGPAFFAGFFTTDPWFLVYNLALLFMIFFALRLQTVSLSAFGILESLRLSAGVLVLLLLDVLYVLLVPSALADWRFSVLLAGFLLVLTGAGRISKRFVRLVRHALLVRSSRGDRVLIVGAGDAGTMLLREMQTSKNIALHPVLFVDDNKTLHNTYVGGVRVAGTTEEIPALVERYGITRIIIAIPSAKKSTVKRIHDICLTTRCKVEILPGIYQFVNGQVSVAALREIDVQDLLGRESTPTDLDAIMGYIQGRTVLVTGGGGSIGSELCRQIATHGPRRLIILDIYENNAYDIEQELRRKLPELDLVTLIASVRDAAKIDRIFAEYRPEIVFHAAAHKHVPLMETSPSEAVKNNVFGTRNVVTAADKYGVLRFVMISTDKAVNPTNVMGATKRICEMIVQTAARHSKTEFAAVRFGNVLGSNGSVIPLFRRQIAEGGPVTLTHKDIIRYFMTIPEAVSLVLQAGAYAKGGEIFVLDMGEPVRIYDLACNLIRLSGFEPGSDIEIRVTGLRPGEKLYEERLMAEEGMAKTANDQISIGRPLDIDEEKLSSTLERLAAAAAEDSPELRSLVRELVPTYRYTEN